MVIGYYPGCGGNRYLRYLNNLEYSTDGIIYDWQVENQLMSNRYLLDGGIISTGPVLTHCLNIGRIKSLFPDKEITFLSGDLKKCLHREWVLEGHTNRYNTNTLGIDSSNIRIEHYNAVKDSSWPDINSIDEFNLLPSYIKDEVNLMYQTITNLDKDNNYQRLLSSFATIDWHHKYYSDWPVDYGNAKVIDIDNNDSEFTQVMRRQLNVDINPMFELAWVSYKQFGSDAKLTEIYEQHKK